MQINALKRTVLDAEAAHIYLRKAKELNKACLPACLPTF